MRFILLIGLLGCLHPAFSQLVVYTNAGQSGTSATCNVSTIYTGAAIPGGLNDAISSIELQQGYMATLAENEDGTGAAYTFIAAISNVTVNLNMQLDDKVSFIRVLPFRNTLKKGVGLQNNAHIDQLDVSWFYDWGASDVSLTGREYALMSWGKQGATNPVNTTNYINKNDVTHLLSFNEPDNADQSNIPVAEAVAAHRELQKTGLRLGSPAPTESQAYVWLTNFMAGTRQANTKVDYMAVHWYDWGSYLNTGNTAPDPNSVFNRFKTYINRIYAIYGKPIWITEFNANRNTTSATHEAFIQLALPWLEAQPFVERYAYFFPPALPPVDGSGNITPIGAAYKNFAASTPAITKNYDNTELLNFDVNVSLEAENAYLFGPTASNCATASGGRTVAPVTGTNQVSFLQLNVPASGTYNVTLHYFSTTSRNVTVRTNHGTAENIALTASGVACGSGGSPGSVQFPLNLLAGENTIELTNAPITDRLVIQPSGSLPVSLMGIAAALRQQQIEVKWTTAQEQNSKFFEVLKSTDGNNFTAIGKVNATGNSHAATQYQFVDRQPTVGTNFYKLKMVDADGSFTYSASVAVKFGAKAKGLWLLSATAQRIQLSACSDVPEKASIKCMSVDGKVLAAQTIMLNSGSNMVTLPNSLPKGSIGIVTLQSNTAVHSLRIMW